VQAEYPMSWHPPLRLQRGGWGEVSKKGRSTAPALLWERRPEVWTAGSLDASHRRCSYRPLAVASELAQTFFDSSYQRCGQLSEGAVIVDFAV
jgi:hypothetical protein